MAMCSATSHRWSRIPECGFSHFYAQYKKVQAMPKKINIPNVCPPSPCFGGYGFLPMMLFSAVAPESDMNRVPDTLKGRDVILPCQQGRHAGSLMGSGTLSSFSRSIPNKAFLVHLHFKLCQSQSHLGILRAVPTDKGLVPGHLEPPLPAHTPDTLQ